MSVSDVLLNNNIWPNANDIMSYDNYDKSTKASLFWSIRTSGKGDFPEHPRRVFHIHSETSLSLLQITELCHMLLPCAEKRLSRHSHTQTQNTGHWVMVHMQINSKHKCQKTNHKKQNKNTSTLSSHKQNLQLLW